MVTSPLRLCSPFSNDARSAGARDGTGSASAAPIGKHAVASANALANINFRISTAPCFDSVDTEQAVKRGCRQAAAARRR
jgi:hypothetical protein